jgi:hypothetical protein
MHFLAHGLSSDIGFPVLLYFFVWRSGIMVMQVQSLAIVVPEIKFRMLLVAAAYS